MFTYSRLIAGALLAMTAVAACNTQTTPTPPTTSASPSVSPSAPDSAPTTFRDDFEQGQVDESRWSVVRRSGLVQVADGRLELLNTGAQPNFPYLLARPDVIPKTGPFFYEVVFKFISWGTISFSLDYLPPEDPERDPLTEPFVSTYVSGTVMRARFDVDGADKTYNLMTSDQINQEHRFRVENNGSNVYRVIIDNVEKGTFESDRRPTRLWIGSTPLKSGSAQRWPRVQIDFVEAGALGAPLELPKPETPATAEVSPEPEATATAS